MVLQNLHTHTRRHELSITHTVTKHTSYTQCRRHANYVSAHNYYYITLTVTFTGPLGSNPTSSKSPCFSAARMKPLSEPLLPKYGLSPTAASSSTLLWHAARPRNIREGLLLLLVLLFLLGSKLLNVALPLVMRHLVNVLSGPASDTPATSLVIIYCSLAVATEGCNQLQQLTWGRLFYKITQRVSLALFKHLHALSVRWHLERRTGEVLTVLNQGVGAVGNLLQIVTFQLFGTVLELVMTSVVFLHVGVPAISLCVTAGAAIYTGYTVFLTQLRTTQRRTLNDANRDAQELVVDSLINFETVKVFASERREADRFDGLTRRLAQLQESSQDSLSLLNWGQTVAMQLGMAGGLLVACLRTTGGQTTVGDFVMVQLYIVQLFQPLANLGGSYRMLMQAITDLEKAAELLHVPIEVTDAPDAADLASIIAQTPSDHRDVRFSSVSFRYDSYPASGSGAGLAAGGGVSHLSFRIPPGGSVALVGPSGGGKSTCTRLLCRLFDPTGGAVLVCGVDVRSVSQESLRTCISCVTQDTVLFNASVAFNLCYGAPGATDAQIRAACRLARVDEFVGRLEHGLSTTVGERGLKLSGGEKQRLGIARALLREPTVLILDEATSALDSETEREVQVALDAAARGRCTLTIAHRLSTIVHCEEVVVLAGGAAIERGTHAALLLQSGSVYSTMWARQTVEESASAGGGAAPPRLSPDECKSSVDEACRALGGLHSSTASTVLPPGYDPPPLVTCGAGPAEPPRAAPSRSPATQASIGSGQEPTAIGVGESGSKSRVLEGGDVYAGDGGDSGGGAGSSGNGGGDDSRGDSSSAPPSKNANEKAELDGRFLLDLWLLLHIGLDRHPPAVLLSEIVVVAALTALALLLLPIPASYAVQRDGEDYWSSAHFLYVGAMTAIVTLALVLPIRHFVRGGRRSGSSGNGGGGSGGGGSGGGGASFRARATKHLRRRSLPVLFGVVQLYNISGFFVSLVPSLIYQALIASPRQCGALPALLLRALGYILCVTVSKALVSVTQSSAALLWRGELTGFIHARYLHRGAHYHLALLQPGVDNPDQRIARELDLWSTSLADLLVAVATSLFNIGWYTLQTWLITGWQGPALIFIFFLGSATITRLVAFPVAALTARCQAAEGDFRAMHASLIQASEATAMCSNGEAEGAALGDTFAALIMLRWRLVVRRGALSLATFFFEYLGTIVSALPVALAALPNT